MAESIETLNKRLVDHFGLDSDTGRAMFRIVWSDEQLEKRLVDAIGRVQLLFPEVREVPKYPWIKSLYVLERLVVVPDINRQDLPVDKLSYEPLWVYCDDNRHPIPPLWEPTKFIVDTLYAALGKKSMRKYIEDEKETSQEGRDQRVTELQKELFGDETDVGDALRYKEGIVVPSNYKES